MQQSPCSTYFLNNKNRKVPQTSCRYDTFSSQLAPHKTVQVLQLLLRNRSLVHPILHYSISSWGSTEGCHIWQTGGSGAHHRVLGSATRLCAKLPTCGEPCQTHWDAGPPLVTILQLCHVLVTVAQLCHVLATMCSPPQLQCTVAPHATCHRHLYTLTEDRQRGNTLPGSASQVLPLSVALLQMIPHSTWWHDLF